jgi:hypothetical protein
LEALLDCLREGDVGISRLDLSYNDLGERGMDALADWVGKSDN